MKTHTLTIGSLGAIIVLFSWYIWQNQVQVIRIPTTIVEEKIVKVDKVKEIDCMDRAEEQLSELSGYGVASLYRGGYSQKWMASFESPWRSEAQLKINKWSEKACDAVNQLYTAVKAHPLKRL